MNEQQQKSYKHIVAFAAEYYNVPEFEITCRTPSAVSLEHEPVQARKFTRWMMRYYLGLSLKEIAARFGYTVTRTVWGHVKDFTAELKSRKVAVSAVEKCVLDQRSLGIEYHKPLIKPLSTSVRHINQRNRKIFT